MKKLRQAHLYLGCIFAPVLIFFAVSGAWQLFDLHRGRKDHSYVPPRALVSLSAIHMRQQLPSAHQANTTPLRVFILLAATGLVLTTALGIVMAFRFTRSKTTVAICLAAGVAVPAAMLFLFR